MTTSVIPLKEAALEPAQALAEHRSRNRLERVGKVVEALRPLGELRHDRKRPAVAHDGKRLGERKLGETTPRIAGRSRFDGIGKGCTSGCGERRHARNDTSRVGHRPLRSLAC